MSDVYVTLQDIARREDPNGKIDKIVEMMTQTNEILEDMHWQEGNLPTGHKTTIRTGLPDVAWRMLNYGVKDSKSTTTQITDTCGMLEAYAEIDKDLADLNGNTAEFRLSEDRAFLEAMNQEFARTLIYGDKSKPEQFVGFAPRFSTATLANAQTAANVIDAGGTGSDNTSIWLVGWGPNTVFGIYPKGLKSGVTHTDLSAGHPEGITLFDANGGKYQGYRTHYKWNCGLCVRDWRYVVRIANIDVSDLSGSGAADLIDLMVQAEELLPDNAEGGTHLSFICNKTVRSFLRRQIMNKTIYQLTQETVAGKHVTMFDGIPIRRTDAILNTESQVV
ncbi:major capsid protein [Selenomonas ruminantium]|uniref:Phage protein n=1 Tax=Selenomonas ruminantium TaxID=971 RepID=A0A1I0VHU5_SELRU|nr:hypothetical protein [Selenomonas ruminantium]SFA75944.1 hypothetical protein SAMN05216587_101632 [Selenomonas ruminantium]